MEEAVYIKLAAHQLNCLSELAMSCVNSIMNMAYSHKRAGWEYAWSAMEASNPKLHSFLQTDFMMSCSHANDVWQYMISKGYYPLEAADQNMTVKVGAMYQVVPEDQPQIQQ